MCRTIIIQPKTNGNRAGTKRKRVMKFSDDDDDESETKTESETKIEDEGICLDDEGL